MAWRAWASCFSRKNRAMASCALSQRPRAWTSLSPQTPVMLNWSSTWPARSATAMRISPRTLALSPLSGIPPPDRGGDGPWPREVVPLVPRHRFGELRTGLALGGEGAHRTPGALSVVLIHEAEPVRRTGLVDGVVNLLAHRR